MWGKGEKDGGEVVVEAKEQEDVGGRGRMLGRWRRRRMTDDEGGGGVEKLRRIWGSRCKGMIDDGGRGVAGGVQEDVGDVEEEKENR